MSVSAGGRTPGSAPGPGSRGITVDRGVGRSFGRGLSRSTGRSSTFAAGRGGGGRIVDARDGESRGGFSSLLTLAYLGTAEHMVRVLEARQLFHPFAPRTARANVG